MAACGAGACSPSHDATDAGATCPRVGFLGDAAAAPDFDFLAVGVGGAVAPVPDGGSISILVPLQGGQYVFPGVRATNVDGCQLLVVGGLRDLTTRAVTTEQRYVNLVPTGDGWGASGVPDQSVAVTEANFANVIVCPNNWASTDVDGHLFGLEVTIRDRAGRQLTKTTRVVPECSDPATFAGCVCACQLGYVLGQACDPVDAGDGAPDGGVDGAPDAATAGDR
jgi:hypothetical protein